MFLKFANFTCLFLLLCILTGCRAKKDIQPFILEQSHDPQPMWVRTPITASKRYIYIVFDHKSPYFSSRFPKKTAKKQLHSYFKNDAHHILEHLRPALSKDAYTRRTLTFTHFLEKQFQATALKTMMLYWEKRLIPTQDDTTSTSVMYYYTGLLRIPRTRYRYYQRRFLYKQQSMAKRMQKKLLVNRLDDCLLALATQTKKERQTLKSLPPDLPFSTNHAPIPSTLSL